MLKEILATIIQLLVIFGWIVIIRLFWKLPDKIDDLNSVLKEVYSGVVLLLWRFGFLKPTKKGKIIDPKTERLSLTFNIEFLKKLDAHWEEKNRKEKTMARRDKPKREKKKPKKKKEKKIRK